MGKNQDPDPDFLNILDPGSSSATLNIILKIFFRVKRQMEEESKMARKVYIAETRVNLRIQEYWHNKCCSWLRTGTAAACQVGVADFDG